MQQRQIRLLQMKQRQHRLRQTQKRQIRPRRTQQRQLRRVLTKPPQNLHNLRRVLRLKRKNRLQKRQPPGQTRPLSLLRKI